MTFWRQVQAALARETPAYRDPDVVRLTAELDDAVSTLQGIADATAFATHADKRLVPSRPCDECWSREVAAGWLVRHGRPVSTSPTTDKTVSGESA